MNPDLPEAAVDLGAAARRAFADHGGVDLARRAEADPSVRDEVGLLLAALGLADVDPRADDDSLGAAAALCEAAGRVALPSPLPALLLRDPGDGSPFAVVEGEHHRVDHGDLYARWRIAAVDGRARTAAPSGARLATRLGPFVTDLAPDPRCAVEDRAGDVALFLALSGWQVLGAVDRAVELAVEHVRDRVQFGKPLAAFQAVQFQLADAAVAVAGLRELALFTLGRLRPDAGTSTDDALVDVLALRVHALDVARAVLRTCQQLHGAAGVCDEYDISVLVRHVQPALRLPFGADRAAAALADAVARHGFASLFPHGGTRPA